MTGVRVKKCFFGVWGGFLPQLSVDCNIGHNRLKAVGENLPKPKTALTIYTTFHQQYTLLKTSIQSFLLSLKFVESTGNWLVLKYVVAAN